MGREGRNERTDGMIWNPWKEIKWLRGLLDVQHERADNLQNLSITRAARVIKLENALLAIAAEEKPTSNATVKRICKMAREALDK